MNEKKISFEEVLRSAEQGDVSSQYNVALLYDTGTGVGENKAEAFKWYRRAAEQKDALAQYYMGDCYSQGDGVTADAREAVKWYAMAADQGFEPAKGIYACAMQFGELLRERARGFQRHENGR